MVAILKKKYPYILFLIIIFLLRLPYRKHYKIIFFDTSTKNKSTKLQTLSAASRHPPDIMYAAKIWKKTIQKLKAR